MSGIVNKVKDAVSGNKAYETPEGTHGPHASRVTNAADPTVDSDRDHRANPTSTIGSTGAHTTSHGVATGHHGHTGTITGTHFASDGPAPTTAGPHKSDMLNKADPRVDSDHSKTSGLTGTTGAHSSGLHGAHGTTGTSGLTGSHVTTTGVHTSGLAGSHGTTGTTGFTGSHGTTGTHTQGLTGSYGNTGTQTAGGLTGTGPAPNTAGPHKSDVLNKIDPRVDSDLDGSKTVGGNKTFSRDPKDASQVPPSVMREHVPSSIEHSDTKHQHQRRHSIKTSQEDHIGL